MTSRERVYASLRRQPVDRVPVFMWLHPETASRLGNLLEIPSGLVSQAFGDDVRQTWVSNNYAMEGIVHDHDGDRHVDDWGIEWVKDGSFNQIARFPLAGASPQNLLEYSFPIDRIDRLMEPMAAVAGAAGDAFLGCDVSPCVFEMYWRLRGMDVTLMEMASEPELTGVMLDKCADFAATLSDEACARFKLDWLWTGDDLAGQNAPMMNPRLWREMVKPRLKRIMDVGKAHGLFVAFHSCGAIHPVIEDLIEIGVDVLNPIQCNCPGMEPLDLKREFGSRLAFMGGVDTQETLPRGTAAEVYAATVRLVEGMMADGGGYILAASHTIPPETPDENIFAMYAAAGITREEVLDRASDIRRDLDVQAQAAEFAGTG